MTCDDAGLIGVSAAIARVRDDVETLAASDVRVLITGDKAVNKSLIARAIHRASARAARPLVHVSCVGLTVEALQTAFALGPTFESRPVSLWLPEQGTLLLDDIAALAEPAQRFLLETLDAGGPWTPRLPSSVRLLTAADRTLADRVARGLFSHALFYRLNVIHLVVPPLRERPDDLPALVAHLLAQPVDGDSHRIAGLSPAAMAMLATHSWPGDIRELADVLEHAVFAASGDEAGPDDLPAYLRVPALPHAD